MKRSQKSLSQQSQEEEPSEDMINEVVKILLVSDATKRPMKQAEVFSSLSVRPSRRQTRPLWVKVKERLDELGFALSDIVVSKTQAYILTANEPELPFMYKYLDKEERADRTLLILVLTFIFMTNGTVTEDDIFRHLTSLKIIDSSPIHPFFGEVKKKITDKFVEQLYLTRHVEPGQDVAVLQWGPRALLEVSRMSILEFTCKIGYGNRMQPQNWASHYEKITSEEIEGNED